MLNTDKHRTLMFQIIKAIFLSPLWPHLALKGWTACYFLYGLDRFSTDLDFDILHETPNVDDTFSSILKKFGQLKTGQKMVLSYGNDETNIKIDVSRKIWKANQYEEVSFFWTPIRLQTPSTIFANKLVALLERMANRDMYDVYFFFQHVFDINEAVVKERTGKSVKEVLQLILAQLVPLPNSHKMLDGLGELLNEKQKIRVKQHLLSELISLLKMKIAF